MENMTDIYSPPPATPMPANKNSIIENIKGKMTGNSENVSQTDNVPGQNMDQSQNIIYHETGKWQDRLLFWVFIGGVIGAIFVYLAIVDIRFLVISPLGPGLGALAWILKQLFTSKTKPASN